MNRRQFVTSLAGLPVVLAIPSFNLPAVSPTLQNTGLQVTDIIRALEDYVAARPGQFSWSVHNELRHHYLPISEDMSRRHADILLAHSVMDSYILHTLSDWHLTDNHSPRNPHHAISVLLNNANQYGHYVHLNAACRIKAAEVLHQENFLDDANQLYQSISSFGLISTLQPYQYIAQSRLSIL